ncbi:MAG: hypothetical protein V9G11_03990 [Bifidobacterium adolescentis]
MKAQLTVAGWLVCLILGGLCCVLAIRGVLSSNREATLPRRHRILA